MARQNLIGTDLDRLSQSVSIFPAWRVILFDLYQDSISDIVLDRFQQLPIDVTQWCTDISFTNSHDTEANQANITFSGVDFNWRLLLFSWVKIYQGDIRVDHTEWPCVFSGVFRGQPSRSNERGQLSSYSHTAYDRSVFFKNRKFTAGRSWQPNQSNVDIGEICREFALNREWGLALHPEEVLFNRLGYRINKKLQIVDIDGMEALNNILQVLRMKASFNGEGKLVVRQFDLDRLPIRIYNSNDLVKSVQLPQQPQNIPTSVTVKGLDYRLSRVDHRFQKILSIGPITVGMFTPRVTTRQSFSDNDEYRVVVDSRGYNVRFQGELLVHIFGLDSEYEINISQDGDYHCFIEIIFKGAIIAIIIVTATLAAFFALKVIGAEIGSADPLTAFIGWSIELLSIVLLMLIMQTIRSLGKMEFEVWGTPFEYVYKQLEAKAILADIDFTEDESRDIEQHILGTLEEVETQARNLLRQYVAETAQRDVVISDDLLLEPNDVIELDEEGVTARYYITQVQKTLKRGDEITCSLSAFRAR